MKENIDKDCMEKTILTKAEDLFISKGYNGVSTIDIANSVGCNQALVHYYFRTKMNLFKIVFSQKINQIQKELEDSYREQECFENKIKKMIDVHFDFLLKDARLPLFIINEINNNNDTAQTIKEVFKDTIFPILSAFQKDLDQEIKANRIRQISAFDLLINIVSLDVFIFISEPIMRNILSYDKQDMNNVFHKRKEEIKNTILLSLKPVDIK
ncbi:MAG: TetR/AcrR family transcriptional regulator [Bacteroidales bacterium]|jgi:AcrR family transcriptional regulator|nr:TetR/AcrR family transcriptional regulator [Bacteroidales bacterium]